jgi:large subunit ribosomal protein L17
MHRHGYQEKKLSLPRDQREALLRGLMTSLVLHEQINTTLAKAKAVAPEFERVITYAKKGTLHGQRQARKVLLTENAVQKLFQELVPAFADRNGGYTRVVKSGTRRGDNAEMAILGLVLPLKPIKAEKPASEAAQDETPKKAAPKTAKAVKAAKTAEKAS